MGMVPFGLTEFDSLTRKELYAEIERLRAELAELRVTTDEELHSGAKWSAPVEPPTPPLTAAFLPFAEAEGPRGGFMPQANPEEADPAPEASQMTFEKHKRLTALDCEEVAKYMTELVEEVRNGNMGAFQEFWIEGGTEEGDARILYIREMLALRFYHREEALRFG